MNSVKIISKNSILHTELFDIVDTVVEKNGKQYLHKNIDQKEVVFVFPLTTDNEIYLVRQYRYLLEKEMIEAVAGFINDNEDPLVAAKRELQEETGLTAQAWKKLGTIERGASVVRGRLHMYVATELSEGEQNLDEFEEIEIVKLPFPQALEDVMNGEMNTAITMLGMLMIDKLQKGEKL